MDVLIVGGGVAGLWCLAAARAAGLRALLVESRRLGAGQTVASQGIIHGGVKYALTGTASRASEAIREMPARWNAALEGADPSGVDLRGVEVLSESCWLFTTGSIGARLVGLAARAAIRTQVEGVAPDERPGPLRPAPASVDVYRVRERVVNPVAVLDRLRALGAGWIVHAQVDGPDTESDGWVVRAGDGSGRTALVQAGLTVLTAGTRNADLAGRLAGPGSAPVRQQARGLHMVMFRGEGPGAPESLFAHALDASLSDKPRLTITTHRDRAGRRVWYIGGRVAEEGLSRDEDEQVGAGVRALRDTMRWITPDGWEAATLRVERAEGFTAQGQRPDTPVCAPVAGTPVGCGRVVCVWPTKLAFAPAVGDRVVALARAEGLGAGGGDRRPMEASPLADWPVPSVAEAPWDDPERRWRRVDALAAGSAAR